MNEEVWKPLNKEIIFDINEHLIWKIEDNEENIETPVGYIEIKKDKISYQKKIYTRRFFVNSVPVKAKLYKNSITKEISYYFEGTPIQKEKTKKIERG